ncbi:MAG: AAA family ATPase [Opitutales bacterium]
MKIQQIELTNYKAFLGTHKIKVGGKNLFIYGENGSGKSSLYYALKDFFQSSIEDIDLAELENAFVKRAQKGKTAIKVAFKPNSTGQNKKKDYLFDHSTNATRAEKDTSIRDGNKLKSFLTYRHLLAIHHLKKNETINLFDLLVGGVLKHFKYSLTGGKELGELWANVEEAIARDTGKNYPINRKKADVKAAIKAFNETMEFYAERCKDGTDMPLIYDDQDLITTARRHLQACDYKASAVYARSHFHIYSGLAKRPE